jgi:recombination protein RecA
MRLDIRRIASIKQGDELVGNRARVKVVKNKLAAPFREAEFDIMFGKGISLEGDVLDIGVKHEIVKKSGSWFSYKDQRLGQGREAVKEFLATNPEIFKEIDSEIRITLQPAEDKAAEDKAAEVSENSEKAGATAGDAKATPIASKGKKKAGAAARA